MAECLNLAETTGRGCSTANRWRLSGEAAPHVCDVAEMSVLSYTSEEECILSG